MEARDRDKFAPTDVGVYKIARELVDGSYEADRFATTLGLACDMVDKLDSVRPTDLDSSDPEDNQIYVGREFLGEAYGFLMGARSYGHEIEFGTPRSIWSDEEISEEDMELYGKMVDTISKIYHKTVEAYSLVLSPQGFESQIEDEAAAGMSIVIEIAGNEPAPPDEDVVVGAARAIARNAELQDRPHAPRALKRRVKAVANSTKQSTKNYLAGLVKEADDIKQAWGYWVARQVEVYHQTEIAASFTDDVSEERALDILNAENMLGEMADLLYSYLRGYNVRSHKLAGLRKIAGKPIATALAHSDKSDQAEEEIGIPGKEVQPAEATIAACKLINLIESGGHRLSKKEGKERDKATRKLANQLHRAGLDRPVAGLMVAMTQGRCDSVIAALEHISSLPPESQEEMNSWDPKTARGARQFDPVGTSRTVLTILQNPAEHPEPFNIFTAPQRETIIRAAQRVEELQQEPASS